MDSVRLNGSSSKADATLSNSGLANAAMAGGIAFDTFSGRKMEWEILDHSYVDGVLAANGDHLVCSAHKTSKTYGSIAKLLTPGLFEAFQCYNRLHRPADCTRFLVPAVEGAENVALPSALRGFCKAFFADDVEARPTFNIMRKMFHRELHTMSKDTEKLKELMVVLDAHSKRVQDTHYILRDASDDVKLAKALVKAVLGKTVQWPSDAAADLDGTIVKAESDEDLACEQDTVYRAPCWLKSQL